MSRIWRIIAPVAIAGGLITAGVMPAQATSAAVSVTINATSPHYAGAKNGKVDGFALVVYKTTFKHLDTALISSTVDGAMLNDTATLMAKPFGATAFTSTGQSVSLTGASSQLISFPVKPSLATAYEVQVTTASVIDATSSAATVYVTAGGFTNHLRKHCSGLRCKFTFREFTVLPSSAYRIEAGKHVYVYDIIFPPVPSFFTLSRSGTASTARKINAGEFEKVITVHITFRNSRQRWFIVTCTKDTESRDGMGLPGHHGCGAKRFSIKAIYLG